MNINARLSRLETSLKGGGVGLIEFTGTEWRVVYKGTIHNFQTMKQAENYLKSKVQIIITDDI